MMYIQENDETMPGTDFWSSVDGVSGKILICPTAGKKIANAYGVSNRVLGRKLGDIKSPENEELTMDAVEGLADNLVVTVDDVAFRHTDKAIVSYVDSHVILTKNVRAVLAPPEPALYATTGSMQVNNTDVASTSSDGRMTIKSSIIRNGAKASFDGSTIDFAFNYYTGNVGVDYLFGEVAGDPLTATKGWNISFVPKFNTVGYANDALSQAQHDLKVIVYDNTDKEIAFLSFINLHECGNMGGGRTNISLCDSTGSPKAYALKAWGGWHDMGTAAGQAEHEAIMKAYYEISAVAKAGNELSISASATGIFVTFGPYKVSYASVANSAADWKKPAKIRFEKSGFTDHYAQELKVTDLEISVI